MKRLFITTICMALATTASFGAKIVVPTDYDTIQEAVTAASDGDIINVLPGIYAGGITVDKSVSIRGVEGSDVTFVAASPDQNGFAVIASDVTISGFTISGATDFQSSGVLIGGLFPGDNAHLGVTDVTVTKCVLQYNCVGVYVWKADDSMIVNNTVRENDAFAEDWEVRIYGGNGIIVWEGPSLNTSIVNNEVYRNFKYGIFVGADVERDFTGTKINGNNLYKNGAYGADWNWLGMGFYNALGSIKVSGNKILATDSGLDIWVWNAPDLRVAGNPIREGLGPNIPMPTP